MRLLIAGLAFAAAACSGDISVDGGDAASGEGYTLEVRATGAEQTYLVTAPDGRVVGARAAEGASALMNSDRARALAGDPPPQGDPPPEVMSLRFPGVDMQISAEESGADGDSGRANVSIGAGGHNIVVHADEGGPGEADDRAYVRITGADEGTVRDFISDAEELSPQVKAEMFAELGLSPAQPGEAQP
jgi:hypothetical protein